MFIAQTIIFCVRLIGCNKKKSQILIKLSANHLHSKFFRLSIVYTAVGSGTMRPTTAGAIPQSLFSNRLRHGLELTSNCSVLSVIYRIISI